MIRNFSGPRIVNRLSIFLRIVSLPSPVRYSFFKAVIGRQHIRRTEKLVNTLTSRIVRNLIGGNINFFLTGRANNLSNLIIIEIFPGSSQLQAGNFNRCLGKFARPLQLLLRKLTKG